MDEDPERGRGGIQTMIRRPKVDFERQKWISGALYPDERFVAPRRSWDSGLDTVVISNNICEGFVQCCVALANACVIAEATEAKCKLY